MLRMSDADRAFELIKAAYGPLIQPELLKKKASDVYVFCSELEFATWLQMTYVTAFKQANSVLIPDLEHIPRRRNRGGFPSGENRDSSWQLEEGGQREWRDHCHWIFGKGSFGRLRRGARAGRQRSSLR